MKYLDIIKNAKKLIAEKKIDLDVFSIEIEEKDNKVLAQIRINVYKDDLILNTFCFYPWQSGKDIEDLFHEFKVLAERLL